MPKIIDGIKENIFTTAKTILFEEGYTALTLRTVAKRCAISVGTIYNYFPNKLMLVASIMAEDWHTVLETTDGKILAARGIDDGLFAIYEGICSFCTTYEPIWNQYNAMGATQGMIGGRHSLLRGQIACRVDALIARFRPNADLALTDLFAECVIAAAMQKDISYDLLSKMCLRIYADHDTTL